MDMDTVHNPQSREWINQNKTSVAGFIQSTKNKVKEINLESFFDGNKQLTDSQKQELIEAAVDSCQLKNLVSPDDDEYLMGNTWESAGQPDHSLLTLSHLKMLQTESDSIRSHEDSIGKSIMDHNLANHEHPEHPLQSNMNPKSSIDLVIEQVVGANIPSESQALITVQLYRCSPSSLTKSKPRPDQVFMVLSTQELTQLKDVILCWEGSCRQDVSDSVLGRGESGENSTSNGNEMENVKPGTFFIDGVFYDDMRSPESKSYSRYDTSHCDALIFFSYRPKTLMMIFFCFSTIIEFYRSKTDRQKLAQFSTKDMRRTKFSDLNFRLGQPYLYLHLGNCEHLLVFSSIRTLNRKSDSLKMSDYPKFIYGENRDVKHPCHICRISRPEYLVADCIFLSETPCHLCKKCLVSFCYDSEGHKKCEFQAYRMGEENPCHF